jgi:sulfonate transport system permease protein
MVDVVRRRPQLAISAAVCVAMIVGWQLLSVIVPGTSADGGSVVPGWQDIFGRAFKGLADYWPGGLGIEATADGGSRNYGAAILALGYHSLKTLERLVLGLGLGAAAGMALGLLVSWSPWARRIVGLPTELIRALPLLAMIPLFSLWFGITLLGSVLFTAFGTGVVFFAGTVNAVANVPQRYIDNARTLGSSKLEIYRRIILPATFPELRTTILLALGIAWSTVAGSEFLGAQDGLGQIIVYSQLYGFVDRMVVVALLFIAYAVVSYLAFERLARRFTVWAPTSRKAVS